MNYYNENDPRAAAWLRELVSNGLIPPGHVDDRSIAEVQPSDLVGYTQCHFFAGIGGWSYALQLAGWPTDRPIWTASCPCQPFSVAGKGLGTDDERHLWPVVANLVRQCNPPIVIGEQVASKAGREWLTGVFTDLEGMAYAVAGADLCAAGVGAPHIRQRLYWVANSTGRQCKKLRETWDISGKQGCPIQPTSCDSATNWSESQLVHCRDGKARRIPTEPAFFPLAHGVPARVVRLRGYGNAIVPQVAATFIQAIDDIAHA